MTLTCRADWEAEKPSSGVREGVTGYDDMAPPKAVGQSPVDESRSGPCAVVGLAYSSGLHVLPPFVLLVRNSRPELSFTETSKTPRW